MKLNPTPTPPRIRVLEFLEKNPGQFAHGEGAATLHCLQLGWADYARNDRGDIIGQHLTDQGRAILSAHRLAQIQKPTPGIVIGSVTVRNEAGEPLPHIVDHERGTIRLTHS